MSANDIKIVLVAKHSKNEKFENLLKQVFPTEIPVTMIDSIIIEFRDGTNAKLDQLIGLMQEGGIVNLDGRKVGEIVGNKGIMKPSIA